MSVLELEDIEIYDWDSIEDDNAPMFADRSIVLDLIIPEKFQIPSRVAQYIANSTKKTIQEQDITKIEKLPFIDIDYVFDGQMNLNTSKLPPYDSWETNHEIAGIVQENSNHSIERDMLTKEVWKISKNVSEFLSSSIRKDIRSYSNTKVDTIGKHEIGKFEIDKDFCLPTRKERRSFVTEGWSKETHFQKIEIEESFPTVPIKSFHESKVNTISPQETASAYDIDPPLLIERRFSTFSNFDLEAKWTCDLQQKPGLTESEKMDYRNSILTEEINQELLYKIKTPYLPKLLLNSYSHTKINSFIKTKWKMSKIKMTSMSWKPFRNLSKDKILLESFGNTQLLLPFPYNSEVMRVKAENLELFTLELEKNTIELNVVSELTTTIISDPCQDVTTPKLPLSLNSSITNDEGSEESSLHNNKLKKTTNDALENSTNMPIMNNASSKAEDKLRSPPRPQSTMKRKEPDMSLTDSLVLKKKRKLANSQYLLGTNDFPFLDVLNHSTKIMVDNKSQISLAMNNSNNTLLGTTFLNELNDTVTPETLSLQNNLQFSSLEKPNMYRQVAFSFEFMKKYRKVSENFQRYSSNLENKMCLYEIQNESSAHTFDIFISETCGILVLSPIKAYQIDVVTNQFKIFRTIEEIAIHVESVIIVVLTNDHNDRKLIEFQSSCKNFGIQTILCNETLSSLESCLCELIEKYGSVMEVEDSKEVHGINQFSDEHIFLFNCGIINPILVSTILTLTTLNEFVQLDSMEKQELFKDIIPRGILNHLSYIFSEDGGETKGGEI